MAARWAQTATATGTGADPVGLRLGWVLSKIPPGTDRRPDRPSPGDVAAASWAARPNATQPQGPASETMTAPAGGMGAGAVEP